VVEAGAGRGGRRVADRADDGVVVLAAVGHRRMGRVRYLEHQLVDAGLGLGQERLPGGQLVLQGGGGGDLGRPLLGCRPADLPGGGVLAGPELLDLGEGGPAGLVGGQHLVDQPRRHPLALDPGPVLGLRPQPTDIDQG
jgi:hypothetical protein